MRPPPSPAEFQRYPVTAQTIGLAIVVTAIYWSGKYDITPLMETIDIRRWQLWRILTSTLPHADVMHIVFNCYWTWVFGTLVESQFGHLKTLGIFILLAFAANGAEFVVLDGGIGLSGIGYGLFGLIWALQRLDRRFADVIDPQTTILFVIWFFICIALTYSGDPIANVAHGVGGIAGAILGYAIAGPGAQKTAARAGMMGLILAVLVGTTVARPYVNFSDNRGDGEARLGYDALMADRNREARKWLLDATYIQPTVADYWINLGIACDRLELTEESREAFKRADDLSASQKPPVAATKNSID